MLGHLKSPPLVQVGKFCCLANNILHSVAWTEAYTYAPSGIPSSRLATKDMGRKVGAVPL